MAGRVIVGVFPDRASAERAIVDLKAAGFDPDHMSVLTRGAEAGAEAIVGALAGRGVSREEAEYYDRRAGEGRALLTVDSAGREAEARAILLRGGAEDTWRTIPWAAPRSAALGAPGSPTGPGDTTARGMPPRTGQIVERGTESRHGLGHGPAWDPDTGRPLPTEADLTARDREHAYEDEARRDDIMSESPCY